MDSRNKASQPRTSHSEHFIKAAKMFPDTIFIQGHIGGGGDWQWCLRMHEEKHDNIYIDTSNSVIDTGMVKKTIDVFGEDRVLFATDMSLEEGVGKILDAQLTDQQLKKILHDNLSDIFKRSTRGVLL